MSRAGDNARGKKRFGYLAAAAEPDPVEHQGAREPAEGQEASATGARADAQAEENTGANEAGGRAGGEGREQAPRRPRARGKPVATELKSVPKGEGRMKQERSQLNVRIPTTLKRRASAKAVLEGKDIGEVVEDLLRRYLDR